MKKSASGFTIVELLIVIVVIAILATISIVAYNGVQNRARNTKTISAVAAWAKAIKLYAVDNGAWPTDTTCLGDIGSYDGDGRCWSSNVFLVNATTVDALRSYMNGNIAVPDLTRISNDSGTTIRGGRYQADTHQILYVLIGTSDCPIIGGINQTYKGVYSGGVQCGGAVQ